jgi:quercetin dioxygenase-like cupin family protein
LAHSWRRSQERAAALAVLVGSRHATQREHTPMQTEAATNAKYTVKNIEVVAKGIDVQARIFTLAPGEVIPWHRHNESTDHYFVLHGTLTINTRNPR